MSATTVAEAYEIVVGKLVCRNVEVAFPPAGLLTKDVAPQLGGKLVICAEQALARQHHRLACLAQVRHPPPLIQGDVGPYSLPMIELPPKG